MNIEANGQEVVFVLGIARRSGTNFLSDLLVRHPDCKRVRTIWEDFLVANADKLEDFVRGTTAYWNPKWDADGSSKQELLHLLGGACIAFLTKKTQEAVEILPRYIVTKTPSVENLHLASVFPNSRAIVVVRDGRDVVESSVKSFGWDFETVAGQWARAAENITAAKEKNVPFLLVRFENLVRDLRDEMIRVFSFLDIDPNMYDFEAAANMPVRGSSVFGANQGNVHWGRVEKSQEFNPLKRWESWSDEQRARFDVIAGEQNARFGYR